MASNIQRDLVEANPLREPLKNQKKHPPLRQIPDL